MGWQTGGLIEGGLDAVEDFQVVFAKCRDVAAYAAEEFCRRFHLENNPRSSASALPSGCRAHLGYCRTALVVVEKGMDASRTPGPPP